MDIETLRKIVCPEYHDRLDRAKEMCEAPFAVDRGIELISVSENSARMRMAVRPQDLNSNGVVHGAASYGLADHTFAMICNIKCVGVGQACNIIYHRPCKGPVMEAEATILNESRSLIIVDVKVTCEGKLIASAVCTAFKTERT